MLYILPPPRAPNPPSPWDSILCGAANNSGSDRTPWSSSKRSTPRVRFRSLNIKIEDSSNGVSGDEVDARRGSKSLSECYFAGKGTALVLPAAEAQKSNRRTGANGSNIQKHLQSMFYLLRPEETLKMAVKLESVHPSRTRYLVVVSRMGSRAEESCLLGIDCNEKTTVGLVLRVLADTSITLDGDGGFSVSVCGRHHIFKPVSVQAMWSALQSLHKVSSKAREENYFQGGLTHSWVNYYEERIESDRSCLNEWHAMDNLESRRPPSPDSVRTKPRERDETEKVIRSTLKEIMMSVDLDEVTSKYIRSRLEEDLDMDLGEYKSFIDQEMLIILGQMDAPTEIFQHVYLGSEWNASNYEELQRNGVGHILNVTKEIDNFFPGTFDYLNIRVYDDEKTDLLKHWDDTFKYISKARKEGSKVLVHCKMGVSRSASVVIAYAMKAYDWDFKTAMQHVKDKRSCIKPNTSFVSQLETYQGILDAMKNKEKLQRSKSETNLKSPGMVAKNERVLVGSEPTPIVQTLMNSHKLQTTMSGSDLRHLGVRPKSWSPGTTTSEAVPLGQSKSPPIFLSLENLHQRNVTRESLKTLKEKQAKTSQKDVSLTRNMLMPCDNGESYSVSPNQIMHLPGQKDSGQVTSVKERVSELESQQEKKTEKKKLVLNLSSQFDNANDTEQQTESENVALSEESAVAAQMKQPPTMLRAVLVKKEIWDPGERETIKVSYCNGTTNNACDFQSSVSEEQTVWTSSAVLKTERDNTVVSNTDSSFSCKVINDKVTSDEDSKNNIVPEVQSQTLTAAVRKDGDPFSNQLDKVFDREERRHHRISEAPVLPPSVTELSNEELARDSPSRQNSWSSYDSAVVLGYQGEMRETPSRHSSWGSGDTRTLPSRNSSWGSYDMRPGASAYYINEKGEKVLNPSCIDLLDSSSSGMFQYDKEDIPWYLGTVKRTKQKLEENSCKKPESDKISDSNDKSSKEEESQLPNTTLPQSELVEAVNTTLIESKQVADVENQIVDVNNKNLNSSSAISSEIDIVKHRKKSTCSSRLSASAPESSSMELVSHECSLFRSASNVSNIGKIIKDSSSSNIISTAQCSSVKQHKTYLENLYKDSTNIHRKSFIPDDLAHDEQNTNISGIVRNRKKEFEAKTHSDLNDDFKHKNKVNSLPSSPVSVHVEKENKKGDVSPTSSDPGEDLNLKKLIGKFEVSAKEKRTIDTQVTLRPKVTAKLFHKNARHSCFEVSVEKNHAPIIHNYNKNVSIVDKNVESDYKRPPISPTPNVVVATVIAKAVKKQQQYGKSHPLARLNIRPRHNSPVYNTM